MAKFKLRGRTFSRSGKSRWGLWLAAIALTFQCFVVQTHVDFAPAIGAPAAFEQNVLSADHGVAASSAEKNGQIPCAICQELALAGAFMHAPPPALTLVTHALMLAAPVQRAEAVRTFPAHSWQSRGPPILL